MEGYDLGAYGPILSALQGRQQQEDTRRWDLDFGLRSKQLGIEKARVDMQYKIAKLQAQTQREAIAVDRWKAEKDYELGLKQLELDRERVGIERYRSETERGAQGLQALQTDVQLRQQPRSWTALADWEAGVEASPFAVDALRQLVANTGLSAGSQTPGAVTHSGLPQQNSLAATLSGMGLPDSGTPQTAAGAPAAAAAAPAAAGAGAAKPAPSPIKTGIDAIIKQYVPSDTQGWDDKDRQTLGAVAMLAGMGEQKYANAFTQMDEDDQDLILGGMARLGRNPDRVLRNIDRLRVSQGNARLA